MRIVCSPKLRKIVSQCRLDIEQRRRIIKSLIED